MNFRSMHLALILALAAISGAVGCGGGTSTAKSPTPGVSGVHSAYVANSAAGTISEYAIDTSGVLHEITGSSPFKLASNPTKLIMTPDGNFLYAIDPSKNTIYSMSINSSTGVLTLVNTQTSGATPAALAIDPKSKFLYVGNGGANNISVYSIGSDGKLTETAFSPVAVNGPVQGVTTSAKGTYLFASVPSTGVIYQFAMDASTGALTAKAGSPMAVGTSPTYVAVSPDESFAIVLGADSALNRLNIDPTTGALTVANFSPFIGGTQPLVAFVDSSNLYVYILNRTSNSVTTVAFQTNGAPYQLSKAGTGTNPTWMAVSGAYLYVTNQDANSVTGYSVAAGVLTLASTGSVATGTTPTSIAVR